MMDKRVSNKTMYGLARHEEGFYHCLDFFLHASVGLETELVDLIRPRGFLGDVVWILRRYWGC